MKSFRSGALMLGMLLVTLGALSFKRNAVWLNEYTLWLDVVSKSPEKGLPHLNLGNALARRKAPEAAAKEFERALQINPGDIRAINGLAVIEFELKNYEKALELFEILVSDKPQNPYFHNNLGLVYLQKGLLDKAREQFLVVIALAPDFADAHNNLGNVYRDKGEYLEAIRAFERVLRLNPSHPGAKRNLSEIQALRNKGF